MMMCVFNETSGFVPTISIRAGLLLAVLIGIAGCGSKTEIRPQGDDQGASSALTSALDAWKSDRTPADLKTQSPPVWVADEDWEAGRTLTQYELDGAPELNGSHWRVYAKLTISENSKESQPQRVCYAVTLGDNISIIRSDFLH